MARPKATRAQRANCQLIGDGRRVYRPDIDVDIAVDDLIEEVIRDESARATLRPSGVICRSF
jgi:hypothetical protein